MIKGKKSHNQKKALKSYFRMKDKKSFDGAFK
jgi:hypothetical protein